ncbi:MAG TPA: 7-cyano-7-deazaguanine synthase QueC [bacterium]|nr:7-cyano-7-deazaguanine synthase QueC [bacterium]
MKTLVLLSGGLDSVVNLKAARDQGEVIGAVTFDYGQAASASEIRAASRAAGRLGVGHTIIALPWYRGLVTNPLMGRGAVSSYSGELPRDAAGLLKEAWIPNRNCVFLAIGGAYAEALGADSVVMGLNAEEAAVFPDNSEEFLKRMNGVLSVSTLSGVKAASFTIGMTKPDIVRFGLEISAPLDLVYSCYKASDQDIMCGTCQSCVRTKAALAANGLLGRLGGRFAA